MGLTQKQVSVSLYVLKKDVTELQHGRKAVQTLHSLVELHSEAKAEPISYCKGCSVLGVLTIAWPCPTITVIDRMMK